MRRVSATWASVASAGWQQVKTSSSRSSGKAVASIVVLHGARAPPSSSGLRGQGAVAADAVDRPVARRRHQPGAGVGRGPLARPALGGDREGLLGGFLGEVEVAEEADQRSEDPAPLLAEGPLEDRQPLHQRAHLDRAAHPGRRDPRGQLDRRVEVVGLEEQVAAERLLGLDERAVGGQRLAVLHPHGRRRLRPAIRTPGVTPGVSLMPW